MSVRGDLIFELRKKKKEILDNRQAAGKESACRAGDLGSTWVGKIPWRRKQLPTPVFWPGDLHGLYSPRGYKELDTTA